MESQDALSTNKYIVFLTRAMQGMCLGWLDFQGNIHTEQRLSVRYKANRRISQWLCVSVEVLRKAQHNLESWGRKSVPAHRHNLTCPIVRPDYSLPV